MAILEFAYDGSQKAITANENCYVRYTLVGGGGGGGGPDTYAGATGRPGNVVNGMMFLNKGETVYVAVGGGGSGGGTQGANRPGGVGGNGLSYFSGGTGGRSGGSGSSGAGGGGGAATVLSRNADGTNFIAIAGGGAGGGGGGDKAGPANHSSYIWGSTSTFSLKYYSNARTNGAYCSFLNTLGIWQGDGRYKYELYFPKSDTYTFTLSADNYAYIWMDNGANGNSDYVGNTPGTGAIDYNSTHQFTHYVTEGWHTVDVYATNWSGPAAVAAKINNSSGTEIWTTRYAYNPLSSKKESYRGGQGQNRGGDGGGAGAGGGGYEGGSGGQVRGGDWGGWNGSNGYDYNEYPSNEPGIGSFASYGVAGIGYARPTGGKDGGGGYAAFEAVHSDISYKNSSWIRPNRVYIRRTINLVFLTYSFWQAVPAIYVRNNGEWNKVYGDSDLTYYTTNSSYDRISGPPPG